MPHDADTSRKKRYAEVVSRIESTCVDTNSNMRMQHIVDALWDALSPEVISWVGFYLDQPGMQDDRRLVLGPRRDKPACSPIGLQGVCGQAVVTRSIRIVRDVRELGPNYIACDPRDQSEIVIPVLDERDICWGVLDIDSWAVGAFDERDAQSLQAVIDAAGFRAARNISQ